MIIPDFLKKGDKISIVSPAGKIKEKHIFNAQKWLEEKGFVVELGTNVFANYFQFAGTTEQRLKDLQTALDDEESRAILCARGGYGTIHILDHLDFTAFKKHPKWLVGYSDITMLHSTLNNLGIASIHGTMPPFFFDKNNEPNKNLHSLMDILYGKQISFEFSNTTKNKPGKTKAEIIGGNLSIICSLLGTKYEIETAGKILFIEEIDEYLYHIDRMMYQLKLAGKLTHLAGLIVGDFTDTKDNDSPFGQNAKDIIRRATKEYNYPVCFGFKGGHGIQNLALPFGIKSHLEVSSKLTKMKLFI